MLRRLVALMAVLALGGASASVEPVKSLSGRYSVTFPNGTIDGDKYTSENIVEIVPVNHDAAYVRIRLEFFNGHECHLWGIANAERDRLVYRARQGITFSPSDQCVLAVSRVGTRLRLNDEEKGVCSIGRCGARGGFDNIELPFSSRRPITYGARIRSSSQFQEAMAEWRNEKPLNNPPPPPPAPRIPDVGQQNLVDNGF